MSENKAEVDTGSGRVRVRLDLSLTVHEVTAIAAREGFSDKGVRLDEAGLGELFLGVVTEYIERAELARYQVRGTRRDPENPMHVLSCREAGEVPEQWSVYKLSSPGSVVVAWICDCATKELADRIAAALEAGEL